MGHRSLRKSAPAKPSRGAVALFAVPGEANWMAKPPFDSTRLVIFALPDEVAGQLSELLSHIEHPARNRV
jgi:hypothetical protein